MLVCCRKVVAVNQVCSESCNNLFFINLSFERTNDGALTTGSSAPARVSDSCCDAVFLCVFKDQNGRENSCIDSSREQYNKNPTSTHISILSTLNQSMMWSSSVQAENSQPGSESTLLFFRAHNKTRQIKERLRDTGCSTEVHSLKVMHCKIAFLLGGTFILCDGCRHTVSANKLVLVCRCYLYFKFFFLAGS